MIIFIQEVNRGDFMTCNTSGGLLIYYYIKMGMNIIAIITPMILLVMCTIDLLSIVSGNKDSIPKAWNRIFKRVIIAIVILLLPAIVSLIMSFTDIDSNASCFNKATKANIEALEREEAAAKRLEEEKQKSFLENQLAQLKAAYNEYKAKQEAERIARESSSSSGYVSTSTAQSPTRAGLLNIAKAEIGNKGGKKYWSWWGYSSRPPWCAIFVSWVANKSGISTSVIPKFEGCNAGMNWFKNKGLWKNNSYSPSPGDIVFFDWDHNGRPDHVGIVESVSNGKVHTIEGNASDQVARRVRSKSDILGYGTPNY